MVSRSRWLIAMPAVLAGAFAACSSSEQTVASGTGHGTSSSGSHSGSGSGGGGGHTASSGTGGNGGSSIDITVAASTGSGGVDPDAGCDAMAQSECKKDSECDDGDPTTIDTCIVANPGSEFPTGSCVHVACDGGPSCTVQAVDPTCSVADASVVYPPFVALSAPDVPASCANGFQLGDAQGASPYVIKSTTAAGAKALTLDLDFATYTAPDGLLITGVDGNCKQYVLFDSCRLKTADQAEGAYTDGMTRPSDVAIRQFHLDLRAGTTQLTFDFSRVVSPMYVQVLGLCDFDLPAASGVGWFAKVP